MQIKLPTLTWHITITLSLTMAYYIAQQLAIKVALPTQDIPVILPEYGIALATFLLFGSPALSAYFICKLLMAIPGIENGNQLLLASFLITSGQLLSLYFSGWLSLRLVGFPNHFINDKSIIRFFLIILPIAAIPYTLITALIGTDITAQNPNQLLLNTVHTWLATLSGMYLFTTAILPFFCKPKNYWQMRRYSVSLPLLTLFLIILVFFAITQHKLLQANAIPFQFWLLHALLIFLAIFICMLSTGLMVITGRRFLTEIIIDERTKTLLSEIKQKEAISRDLETAKNRAEIANQSKNRFLRNMSHELRTPLNGILGFAQLLLDNQQLVQTNREYAETIHHCGTHLLTLINDILDISKIESEKITLSKAPFNFIAFLDDIARIFQMKANEKQLTFTLTKNNLPNTVNSDQKRLRQIIMNLLSNAIKFTEHGNITFAVAFQNEQLQIMVSDTGSGIAAENQESIFHPFVQLHQTDYSEQGAGLGQAITQNLITLMGGTISLHSEPLAGSRFSVSLPLESTEIQPTSSQMPAITGYKGTTRYILLVDDNQQNLKLLHTSLESIGFNVTAINSGQQCLEFCANITPDLIFLDMLMPEMSGIETLQALKKKKKPSYKIVAMSASVFANQQQSYLDAGCLRFLAKPIDRQELFRCLEATMQLEWIYGDLISDKLRESPCHVMIVDDNEINCLLLQNLLENMGCTTTTAHDGEQALRILHKEQFQLALIDLNMPIMGGQEMIQHALKFISPAQVTKFIAISAFTDEQTIQASLQAGFDQYLCKPVDGNQLKNLIHSLILSRAEVA